MNARPNVLWISFEDTNPYYGCYGDPVARTPNLDRLAAEGCVWRRAYSTAGVCAPARSAVITGMYPTSIGTHHMRTTHTNPATPELPTPYSAVLPHYVKCFSEYMRAAGYYCTNNIKTDYQFEPPSTAWDDLSRSGHWRNRPDKSQPFFAVFNLDGTHESGMWEGRGVEITVDPDAIELPPYFPDTPKVRQSMARMYSNIEASDRRLGELLAELEEDGLAENTVVFNWSDHGPLPRGKRWPYDSGIHVPMIVRWPGMIEAGTVSERLVSTIDLAPSVMSICGLEIPAHMQGRAFLGPREAEPREYVFATRDRYDEAYDMVRAVRDSRFKYIRNYRPELPRTLWIPYLNKHPIKQELWRFRLEGRLEGAQTLMFDDRRPVEELYDTEADPWEITNLAGDPTFAGELARLRAALDRWTDEVGDLGRIDEAEMVRGWYPGGVQPTTVAPIFIPIAEGADGVEPSGEGCDLKGPALLQLHTATQGASISYSIDGRDGRMLYTSLIDLPTGATTIRARAERIGFLPSEERTARFVVG